MTKPLQKDCFATANAFAALTGWAPLAMTRLRSHHSRVARGRANWRLGLSVTVDRQHVARDLEIAAIEEQVIVLADQVSGDDEQQ